MPSARRRKRRSGRPRSPDVEETLPLLLRRSVGNHFDFRALLQLFSRRNFDDLSAHHRRRRPARRSGRNPTLSDAYRLGRSLCASRGSWRCVREQFHVENQHGIRWDFGRRRAQAISLVSRDINLPFGANFHMLHDFRPTFDCSASYRSSKLFILIENGAIDEAAPYTSL